ncbi:MAG: DEAD/DEAH box helicase family protein, partial [Eubacterium sp.]
DGIFVEDGETVIDEIKTTTRTLEDMNEDSQPVHWAQAKCYGYIYAKQKGLSFITIQLTYYQVDTQEIKQFRKTFSLPALTDFYQGLLAGYMRWAEMQRKWVECRNDSIGALAFPYETYRRGQREMAVAVFNTIKKSGRFFCQAPTGIGKTLSTLFPAIKALGADQAEKVFYLTAKTITRQAAVDAFSLMVQDGLKMRTVTLTAKDKICFLENRSCNPDDCPYADGYYDRSGDVLYEALQQQTIFSRETIEAIARNNDLCPFEFSLDLTLWCDAIICDYNYLFDPQAALRRFFAEEPGAYVFLIDEAHNLVDRAREMYSAELRKSDFLSLMRSLEKKEKTIMGPLKKVNQAFIDLRKSCPDGRSRISEEALGDFNELLAFLCFGCEAFQKKYPNHPAGEMVLELYFAARSYLKISEFYDTHYVTTVHVYGSEVLLRQHCLDPSTLIKNRLACGKASVLFSA